jgi:hemoglobin-like flavoprotein
MLTTILDKLFPSFDLSIRERSAVRESIHLVIGDPRAIVAPFYRHLGQLDRKFHDFAEPDNFLELREVTLEFLRYIVVHLDHPHQVVPFVRRTGVQLAHLGIEAKDYSTAEAALLLTFRALTNDKERQSFGDALKFVRAVALEMIDAAYGSRLFPPTSYPVG